jgi:hypothetical protein
VPERTYSPIPQAYPESFRKKIFITLYKLPVTVDLEFDLWLRKGKAIYSKPIYPIQIQITWFS